MGSIEDFIKLIKKKEGLRFDKQVANLLGTDNRILATHKNRDNLPVKYIDWFCKKYNVDKSMFYQELKLVNKQIHLEKGDKKVDANYIIELQKDKIEAQNKEIFKLKDALKEKQAESTHWEHLTYDFKALVTLKRVGIKFSRIVNEVTDFKKQSEILGYSEKELKGLWDIGSQYIMEEHPIDKIINKETKKEIQKQCLTLPIVFDAMKASVGDHYIPTPLIYNHKDGHAMGAISYNKIKWSVLKIDSKVQFLTD